MKPVRPGLRHQLIHLDRALMGLLNERARLARELGEDGAGTVEDLLRRTRGAFPAPALRAVFEVIEAGCREAAERGGEA